MLSECYETKGLVRQEMDGVVSSQPTNDKNTKSETERSNHELKTEKLVDYKKEEKDK